MSKVTPRTAGRPAKETDTSSSRMTGLPGRRTSLGLRLRSFPTRPPAESVADAGSVIVLPPAARPGRATPRVRWIPVACKLGDSHVGLLLRVRLILVRPTAAREDRMRLKQRNKRR